MPVNMRDVLCDLIVLGWQVSEQGVLVLMNTGTRRVDKSILVFIIFLVACPVSPWDLLTRGFSEAFWNPVKTLSRGVCYPAWLCTHRFLSCADLAISFH